MFEPFRLAHEVLGKMPGFDRMSIGAGLTSVRSACCRQGPFCEIDPAGRNAEQPAEGCCARKGCGLVPGKLVQEPAACLFKGGNACLHALAHMAEGRLVR